MKNESYIVVLVKPQFEAKKSQVEQGGIISDPNVHANVLNILLSGYKKMGLSFIEIKKSRVLGRKGNQEFFCVNLFPYKIFGNFIKVCIRNLNIISKDTIITYFNLIYSRLFFNI